MRLPEVASLPASPVSRGLLDDATTLTDALALMAERYASFPCLTVVDRLGREAQVTVGALWERAGAVAAALAARGLRPGQPVLLTLPTSPELAAAYFGTLRAGGVPGLVATPSNRVADRRVYAERIGAILRNADAPVLYCDADVADLFTGDARALLGATTLLGPEAVGPATPPAAPPVGPGTVATIQYSSGSTGTPKGILLTHGAMVNNLRDVRDGLGLGATDVHVNWIPLYHDMGLIDAFLLPLLTGASMVLIPTMDFMRDPALWLWAVHRFRGTISWAPNFAYALCTTRVPDEDLAGLDLSSWRIAINAAEPVLAHTIDAFTARFAAHGFRAEAMTPAWGLAENVTIATAHPVGERPRVETIDRRALALETVARPATGDGIVSVAIGRVLPRCAVEIRDGAGRPLPDRHVGTIWLRTDSLFACYHRDPERTTAALRAGWLDTGDQGYLDAGDLFFVARNKDLIVIGGEKYAPHDVETAINAVDGVRQGCCVAFGVLDETHGTEDLAAVVETRVDDPAGRRTLERAIRTAVARATGLGLRHLLLVPPGGIEKTTSGKLARRATRRRWAAALAG